jgi:hypothetical protein
MLSSRYDWGSIGFDHSLFALLKLLLRPLHLPLTGLLHVYMPFAGLVGVLLYFIRVRKLPLANQFLFLTTMSILIPPTSFDYTLVQLYSPFAVLLFAVIDDRFIRMTPMFVTLGFLFTPTNFLFLHGEGFAGQIKAILLTALICFTVQRPASRREPVMDNELRLIGQETS